VKKSILPSGYDRQGEKLAVSNSKYSLILEAKVPKGKNE
jgi:hypothetical protein